MFKINNKQKNVVFWAGILLLVSFLIGFYLIKNRQDTEIKPKTYKPFNEMVFSFHQIYKEALFLVEQQKIDESINAATQALKLWLEIEEGYGKNQPSNYVKTKNWTNELNYISDLQGRAISLIRDKKFLEAHEEFEKIRKKLYEIRRENNIFNISDAFFDLENEVMKIANAKNRQEAMTFMPQLKIYFVELKSFMIENQEYQKTLDEITRAVSELDNSSDKTFYKYKDNLKNVFMKAYLLWG